MKRAILFLATALIGTGCGRRCDFPTLTVYWSFQSSGAPLDCSQAGVATMNILIDGQAVDTSQTGPIPCDFGDGVEGATLTGFTSGTYSVELDGLDASGHTLYTDTQNVSVSACGDTQLNATLAPVTVPAGNLNVAYSFAAGGSCTTPSSQSPYATTFIWYELVDANGNVVSASDLATDPKANPCSTTTPTFVIPNLPFGTYTLKGIEEAELLASGSANVDHYNCVAQTVQHTQAGDTFTSDPMVAQQSGASVTCF